ncbi:MAG: hypothetical protein QM766_18975 [Burkholderiaceae bacterium]
MPTVRVALAVSLFRNGAVLASFAARMADKPLAERLTLHHAALETDPGRTAACVARDNKHRRNQPAPIRRH